MTKYKYILTYPDGKTLDSKEEYEDYRPDEATFDSYEDAEEAALYAIGCEEVGAEIMHMSNPGDYDYNEETYESPTYDIEEID
jgi:hypothetical protein